MPTTAILCCHPQGPDQILFAGGGTPLLAEILGRAVDNGVFDRVVISVSDALPPQSMDALRRFGFDIHACAQTAPQHRLRQAMDDLDLDRACVLNGYSFLIDPGQTARLEADMDATGRHLACTQTKSPFRYQCMVDRQAVRRLDEIRDTAVNPLKLHQALPASATLTVPPSAPERIGVDGLLWLLLVHAVRTGDMADVAAVSQSAASAASVPDAVEAVLRQHGLDLRSDEREQAEIFKICSLIRDYCTVLRQGLGSVRKGRFLEIGYGNAPYSALLHATDFAEGVAIEPFARPDDPDFQRNLALFAGLLPPLARLLPAFRLPGSVPESVTFLPRFLDACGFSDNAFDYCFSVTVLEHVADVDALLRELHRVMRPGSTMAHVVDYGGHSFCTDSRFPFYAFSREEWLGRTRYLNLLRRGEMLAALAAPGFSVEVVREERSPLLPDTPDRDWSRYSRRDLTTVGGAYRCVKK